MADGSLPIVVTPEAFGRDAFDLTVVEGLTVRAMLVEAVKAGLPIEALNRTEIYVDGARLDRETALDHVLEADQVVNVVVEPMGGGGGGRKDIGQILLTVAVIAVSAWVGGGAGGLITKEIWARAAAAAITLGGQPTGRWQRQAPRHHHGERDQVCRLPQADHGRDPVDH